MSAICWKFVFIKKEFSYFLDSLVFSLFLSEIAKRMRLTKSSQKFSFAKKFSQRYSVGNLSNGNDNATKQKA